MRPTHAAGLLAAHLVLAVAVTLVMPALMARPHDALGFVSAVIEESPAGAAVFLAGHPLVAWLAFRASFRGRAVGAAAGALGALLVNTLTTVVALSAGAGTAGLVEVASIALFFGAPVIALAALAPPWIARRDLDRPRA